MSKTGEQQNMFEIMNWITWHVTSLWDTKVPVHEWQGESEPKSMYNYQRTHIIYVSWSTVSTTVYWKQNIYAIVCRIRPTNKSMTSKIPTGCMNLEGFDSMIWLHPLPPSRSIYHICFSCSVAPTSKGKNSDLLSRQSTDMLVPSLHCIAMIAHAQNLQLSLLFINGDGTASSLLVDMMLLLPLWLHCSCHTNNQLLSHAFRTCIWNGKHSLGTITPKLTIFINRVQSASQKETKGLPPTN